MDIIKDAVLISQVQQNYGLLVDFLKANPTALTTFQAAVKKNVAANITAQITALQAQQAALNAQ